MRDKKVKAFIELLRETGVRPQELLSITKADIDFSRFLLHFSHSKSMSIATRSIRLTKNAVKILKNTVSPAATKLFPGLTLSKVSYAWRKACGGAGKRYSLPGFRVKAIAKMMMNVED
jgi:integrase